MKKKLLSSKDPTDFLSKIERRSVTTLATVGNDGTELDTWEKPRKRSVQKPEEKVQLSVFLTGKMQMEMKVMLWMTIMIQMEVMMKITVIN